MYFSVSAYERLATIALTFDTLFQSSPTSSTNLQSARLVSSTELCPSDAMWPLCCRRQKKAIAIAFLSVCVAWLFYLQQLDSLAPYVHRLRILSLPRHGREILRPLLRTVGKQLLVSCEVFFQERNHGNPLLVTLGSDSLGSAGALYALTVVRAFRTGMTAQSKQSGGARHAGDCCCDSGGIQTSPLQTRKPATTLLLTLSMLRPADTD